MRYKNASKKDLPEHIIKAVEKSIQEKKSLFIYGDTGTGKTHAMHAIAKGKDDVENFVQLLAEFRDFMQKGNYFYQLKELSNRKYLFIDDIGSEKTSEFVIEFLYLIVNNRYENMKRTVFSTNLSLEDFGRRYGDRILSRVSEMCVLVELKGEDKRI